MIIETPRLRLRPLTDADMEPYLAMGTDPAVTRYVSPTPIPRASAEAAATHYRRLLKTKGYGYWAIEVNRGASFAAIILLQDVKFTAAFTPAIEVGWLLPREHWGTHVNPSRRGARAQGERASDARPVIEGTAGSGGFACHHVALGADSALVVWSDYIDLPGFIIYGANGTVPPSSTREWYGALDMDPELKSVGSNMLFFTGTDMSGDIVLRDVAAGGTTFAGSSAHFGNGLSNSL